MKKITSIFVLFLGISILFGQTIQVSSNSKVKWTGEKAIGTHWGYLQFSSGELVFDEGKLIDGNFIVDMNSLQIKDTDNKKLLKHIKSDDFFDIEKYPTATLDFKAIDDLGNDRYKVTGTFTIKGKSNDLNFELTKDTASATTTFKFDRQDFDITMKNGVRDAVVYDDIKLEIFLNW